MKKTLLTVALSLAISPVASEEAPQKKHSIWGGPVIWTENVGYFADKSVIAVPEKECPGDLQVGASFENIKIPEGLKGVWSSRASVSKASNMDAYILDVRTTFKTSMSDRFPSLNNPFEPTPEITFTCRESADLTISAGTDGELMFHTGNPDTAKALDLAGVTYSFEESN